MNYVEIAMTVSSCLRKVRESKKHEEAWAWTDIAIKLMEFERRQPQHDDREFRANAVNG